MSYRVLTTDYINFRKKYIVDKKKQIIKYEPMVDFIQNLKIKYLYINNWLDELDNYVNAYRIPDFKTDFEHLKKDIDVMITFINKLLDDLFKLTLKFKNMEELKYHAIFINKNYNTTIRIIKNASNYYLLKLTDINSKYRKILALYKKSITNNNDSEY